MQPHYRQILYRLSHQGTSVTTLGFLNIPLCKKEFTPLQNKNCMAPLYKAESAWVSSKYHEELMNKSSLCREADKRESSVPLPSPQAQSGCQAPYSRRKGVQGQTGTGRFLPGLSISEDWSENPSPSTKT